MRIRKTIEQFEEIPRGYGIAWQDPRHIRSVCYPVPFNKLIGWARWIRWELARPPRGPRMRARDVQHVVELLAEIRRSLEEHAEAERIGQRPRELALNLILAAQEAHLRGLRLLEKLREWERAR